MLNMKLFIYKYIKVSWIKMPEVKDQFFGQKLQFYTGVKNVWG